MDEEYFQIELTNSKRNQHRLKSFSFGNFVYFPHQISLTKHQASSEQFLMNEINLDQLKTNSYQTWFYSLIGSILVGSIGLLPRFIVPNEQTKQEKPYLEFLLSVAVGSQLADVFLHLLPESFESNNGSSIEIGLWILFGLMIFFLIEQIFPENDEEERENDGINHLSISTDKTLTKIKIKTTGYLNMLANFIDNFTHGAAIGGGFSINTLVGLTTLLGIIIHEIPHEMGDFAILLRSGFNREEATKAQLITSLGGIFGSSMALIYSNTFHNKIWVLPFTSGGFLYVALVKTVNDLLKENHFKNSFRQFFGICIGLVIISFVIHFIG